MRQSPVRATLVRAGASSALTERLSAARHSRQEPSIRGIAFENMSGDPKQEYFADGMVEEINYGAVAVSNGCS